MLQLIVLIAVVCVPILSLLAIGTRLEKKRRQKAHEAKESEALKNLYKQQL